MRRRSATILVLGTLTVVFVGLLAVPAAAEITQGSCRGSATFPDKATDKVLDAARPRSLVFEAPTGATVNYTGDLGPGASASDEPVAFEGGVSLQLPRTSIPIASWEGETEEFSYSGTYTYELPAGIPAGTGDIEVSAFHNHTGYGNCAAVVSVSIAGSPGVAAAVAGGLTALSGAATLAAGRKKP